MLLALISKVGIQFKCGMSKKACLRIYTSYIFLPPTDVDKSMSMEKNTRSEQLKLVTEA